MSEPTENTDFSEALDHLKGGERVSRAGWNDKGMWLGIAEPVGPATVFGVTTSVPMTVPFIYMYTADGQFVPWVASQTDLLAEDWVLL